MIAEPPLEAIEAEAPLRPRRVRAGAPRKATKTTRERLMRAARVEFMQHGFAGACVERILSKASVNPRMLYHHFTGKAGLYVAVLETILEEVRQKEVQLDVEQSDPLEGLLQLFDFLRDHFEANPGLVRMLSNENLLKARFMRHSASIRRCRRQRSQCLIGLSNVAPDRDSSLRISMPCASTSSWWP